MMICELKAQNLLLHLFMLAKVLKNELDLSLCSFDAKISRYGQNQQANDKPLD